MIGSHDVGGGGGGNDLNGDGGCDYGDGAVVGADRSGASGGFWRW